MDAHEKLGPLVREWQQSQFNAFEQGVIRGASLAERDAKLRDGRVQRRRDFMAALGTNMAKLDAASEAEQAAQEAALQAFLAEARPRMLNRPKVQAGAAGDAETHRTVLAEAGSQIVPHFASAVFTPDRSAYAGLGGVKLVDGAINSGWVFPENQANIRVKADGHYPNALCADNAPGEAEFEVDFAFTPATTATYEMTAILAFHGFYMLRVDDSWWNCRIAKVKLTVAMNVKQYYSLGAQETTLIDVSEENANEVVSYDLTKFFPYTASLRGGDPVIVSVKGTLHASAHGGGAYSELNFFDSTANYIQPLFLSVLQT